VMIYLIEIVVRKGSFKQDTQKIYTSDATVKLVMNEISYRHKQNKWKICQNVQVTRDRDVKININWRCDVLMSSRSTSG